LISNTKHNKQTRLCFILSKQYAYWTYFCMPLSKPLI